MYAACCALRATGSSAGGSECRRIAGRRRPRAGVGQLDRPRGSDRRGAAAGTVVWVSAIGGTPLLAARDGPGARSSLLVARGRRAAAAPLAARGDQRFAERMAALCRRGRARARRRGRIPRDPPGQLQDAGRVLLATLVVLIGLLLIAGPSSSGCSATVPTSGWNASASGARRGRSGCADDSVLHTLTLIQRNVDDPREVQRLARSQEREWRAWLYKPVADPDATLAAALERLAGEVEDAHSVSIRSSPSAMGHWTTTPAPRCRRPGRRWWDAAKYSGAPTISVYAEVEPELLTIFVRDRGRGFDPDDLPEDRMGVRQSIIGRMQRDGGSAMVRGAPGDGTEGEARDAEERLMAVRVVLVDVTTPMLRYGGSSPAGPERRRGGRGRRCPAVGAVGDQAFHPRTWSCWTSTCRAAAASRGCAS